MVLLTTVLLPVRFPQLVDTFDDGRLLETWYDGYKSYAVMEYHIAYDSSYQWYAGMNYPYGEHIVPAAAHPFFSNGLKALQALGLPTAAHLPRILHGWLLFGLIAAVALLYLVLRGLRLPVGYSIGVALALAFLNPQTERLYAHFGLAQFYALPLLLYGLQRFEYRRSWGSCLLLALTITWLSGIHFYYFAILNAALGLYFLFSFLQQPTRRRLIRYAVRYALIVVPPLLGFFYWIYLNDPVTDRGAAPWGFLFYRAQWESIFLARELPFYQLIESYLIKIRSTSTEGRVYVGIPATLVTLYLLGRWIGRRFKRGRPRLLDRLVPQAPVVRHRFLYALLRAGVVCLLLAMAFPFNLPGMEQFVEYAGPLRQFRSLGRFAWVFFYGINLFAAYLLYHRLRRYSAPIFVAGMLALFGLWAYECYAFAQFFDFRTDAVKERRAGQAFTDIPGIDYRRYQAILPVPYFNVGTAQFGINSGGFSVQKALTLGVQTGLPTTGAMLTRTSAGQSFRQQQLVTEPYRMPLVLRDYPDDRPLIMTYFREMTELDRYRYDHLLTGARHLHTDGGLALYELPLESFAERIAARRAGVVAALQDSTLVMRGRWQATASTGSLVYFPFDEGPVPGYRGNGLLGHTDTPLVVEADLTDTLGAAIYRSTFWLHSLPEGRSGALVSVEAWDAAGTQRLAERTVKASEHFQVYDPLGWTLVDFTLEFPAATRKLRLLVRYPDLRDADFVIDEWLVYPDHLELYRREGDTVAHNNRYYPPGN